MAEAVSRLQTQSTPSSGRLKLLLVPREHGAWGLLLVPLVTAACIGASRGQGYPELALLIVATLALFWMRTPLESYFGLSLMKARTREEKRATLAAMLLLAPLAAACLYALIIVYRLRGLLDLGVAVIIAFVVQAALRLLGRSGRMLAQMAGCVGLTASSAAAYYVVTGKLDTTAFAIWFVCWLFAGDQVHYVQLRLRTAKLTSTVERVRAASGFLLGQVAMVAAVLAASRFRLLPLFAIAAFVPIVARGFLWLVQRTEKIDIPWLGITELLQGITFGAILTAVFLLQR